MSTGDTILRLTGLIYDAALNPDRWSPFLEELAEELDAHLVNITFVDRREYRPSIAVHVRFDPDALQQYTAHYAHIDPWAAAAHIKGLWREGVVELGESLISRSDLMKSAFWNEFGNRFGFQSGMSAVFASAGCQVAVLSAAPRPESPPFGQCTRSLVSALVPHLDRALQIHSRLAASLRCQAALVDVIDQLSMGVVVFDGDGRVVIQNRAATEMFRVRDGLSIDKGAVRAAGRHDDRKLQSLIADALGVASGKVPQGRAITNISRPSLRRPYEVLVSPLKLPAQQLLSQSAAAVMFPGGPRDDRCHRRRAACAPLRFHAGRGPARCHAAEGAHSGGSGR